MALPQLKSQSQHILAKGGFPVQCDRVSGLVAYWVIGQVCGLHEWGAALVGLVWESGEDANARRPAEVAQGWVAFYLSCGFACLKPRFRVAGVDGLSMHFNLFSIVCWGWSLYLRD
jgi:hypothetical protein